VTVNADKIKAVLPVSVELQCDSNPIRPYAGSSPLRMDVGQLAGRLSNRIDW
jgi:hypothetical protein